MNYDSESLEPIPEADLILEEAKGKPLTRYLIMELRSLRADIDKRSEERHGDLLDLEMTFIHYIKGLE